MSVRKLSTASILSPSYKNSKFWDGETFPGYFESIATIIAPSAGQANVQFVNIPNSYTHLQLRIFARTNRTSSPTQDAIKIIFNSDSGSNYSHHFLLGDGTNVSAGASTSRANILVDGFTSSDISSFGVGIIDILDYKNTNKNKTVIALSGWNTSGSGRVWFESGLWHGTNGTNAINSIGLTPNSGTLFLQNSHFALYGIRSA